MTLNLKEIRAKIAEKIQPAELKEKAEAAKEKLGQIIDVIKEVNNDDKPQIKKVSQDDIEQTCSDIELVETEIAAAKKQLNDLEVIKRDAEKLLKQQMEVFEKNHVSVSANKTVADVKARLEKYTKK
jgi:hypothetical protein